MVSQTLASASGLSMRFSNMYANHINYSKRLLRQPFFVLGVPVLIVFEKLELFSETFIRRCRDKD